MTERFWAIDCGNTRLKVTCFGADGRIEWRRAYDSDDVESLMGDLEKNRVRRAGMSCVGKIDPRIVETLGNELDDGFMLLSPSSAAGLDIRYDSVRTLGADRKLTARAAASLYEGESLLVVDAGTAITLDLVEKGGVFAGGNIAPGLQLRFRALNEQTARLPKLSVVGQSEPLMAFGTSTPEAIMAGVAGGVLDEICLAAMRAIKMGVEKLILTGGDAPYLERMLRERFRQLDIRMEIIHEPDLLAKGLRIVYILHHENESKD